VKLYLSLNGTHVEVEGSEGKKLFLAWLSVLKKEHKENVLLEPSKVNSAWAKRKAGIHLYRFSDRDNRYTTYHLVKAALPPVMVFLFRRLNPKEKQILVYLQRLALAEAFSIALEKGTPLPKADAILKEAQFFRLPEFPEYGLVKVKKTFIPLFEVPQDKVARLYLARNARERKEMLAHLLKAGTGFSVKAWQSFLRGEAPAPSLEGPFRPWIKEPEKVLEIEEKAKGMITLNQAVYNKDLEVLQTLLTWRPPLKIDLYQKPIRLVQKAIGLGWTPGLIALLKMGFPIREKEIEWMSEEVLLDLARSVQEDQDLLPKETRDQVIKRALSLL